MNDKNKTMGSGSITLSTEIIKFSSSAKTVTLPGSVIETVNFPNVKIDDLTDQLTISITAVNGIKAQSLNVSGYMKVETGDVEKKISEREAAAQALIRANEVAATPHSNQGLKNYNAQNYD